jgi:hypothetical protein
MRATLFVALEQHEQQSRVAFPQGRQLVNERSEENKEVLMANRNLPGIR